MQDQGQRQNHYICQLMAYLSISKTVAISLTRLHIKAPSNLNPGIANTLHHVKTIEDETS